VPADRALNPGCLVHQITWQRIDKTARNSFNEPIAAVVNVLSCRASVQHGTGREVAVAMQRFPEARYVLRQHFDARCTADLRVSWYYRGVVRVLDVVDVQDDGGLGRSQTIIAKDWIES